MTTPLIDHKLEQRIDALVLCFCMTSLGLVSMGLSVLVAVIFRVEISTWFIVSYSVAQIFGVGAIALFLSASVVRRRLFSLVRDVFSSPVDTE